MKTPKRRRSATTSAQRPKQAKREEPNNAATPTQPQPRQHQPVEPPAHGPWGARLRERNHQHNQQQQLEWAWNNQQHRAEGQLQEEQKENDGADEESGQQAADVEMTEPEIVDILQKVFVGNEVAEVPAQSPGAGLFAMANYTIDNANTLPKRNVLRMQREVPQDELEPTFMTLEEAKQRDDYFHGKLLDAFMEDFKEHFETHFSRPNRQIYDKEQCSKFLHQHFLMCRSPLIQQLVEEFSGRYSTAAWVCFFVENGLGFMMRRYFLHVSHDEWAIFTKPLLWDSKRRARPLPDLPFDNPLATSIREYSDRLQRFREDYRQLFAPGTDKLIENVEEVRVNEGLEIECLVCAGSFPASRAICCNPMYGDRPPPLIELIDKPGTSKATSCKISDDLHRFCVECLVGHARAATQEMPLADGGVGLKCMATDCQNALLFSECRFYIPPYVRHQLNARILEENLGKANIANLERCTECNFGVIIEEPPEELRVFNCEKCGAQHCRLCRRVWDEFHVGRRCDEMDGAQEQLKHHFENLLSEAIIRKCSRCSVPFIKRVGCNMMHCRCGVTQCYICRTPNIDYVHFCQHFRNPGQTDCKACNRKCLLWNLDKQADEQAIARVMEQAERRGVVLTEEEEGQNDGVQENAAGNR